LLLLFDGVFDGFSFLVGFPVQWALAELARVLFLVYFVVFHLFASLVSPENAG